MADEDFERPGNRARGSARAARRFEWHGYSVTVWRGWRLESIERTLDHLANIDGNLYENSMLDRVVWHSLAEADQVQLRRVANRAKARRNVDLMRANSRRQAEVWRARARLEWDVYCVLYRKRWPGTEPVGFDRWSKTMRKRWKADPESVLYVNRSSYKTVRAAWEKARQAERLAHQERKGRKR